MLQQSDAGSAGAVPEAGLVDHQDRHLLGQEVVWALLLGGVRERQSAPGGVGYAELLTLAPAKDPKSKRAWSFLSKFEPWPCGAGKPPTIITDFKNTWKGGNTIMVNSHTYGLTKAIFTKLRSAVDSVVAVPLWDSTEGETK